MRLDYRAVVLLLMASLGAVVLLFVLFFDRYSYYDYHEEKCETGSVELNASLVGSFGSNRPRKRSSPYYLRIEVVGEKKDHVVVGGIGLTSSVSKKNVDLGDIKRIEVKRPGSSVPAVVYLADSLWLEYDDYMLSGVVVAEPIDESGKIAFTCSLNRSYRSEWRIPLWDALMSV